MEHEIEEVESSQPQFAGFVVRRERFEFLPQVGHEAGVGPGSPVGEAHFPIVKLAGEAVRLVALAGRLAEGAQFFAAAAKQGFQVLSFGRGAPKVSWMMTWRPLQIF